MLRILTLLLLTGCPGDDTGSKPDDTDDTTEPAGTVELADAHNGALSVSLLAENTELAEGENCSLDWSGLTADMVGRPIDPLTDITEAKIYAFQSLEPATVLEGLADESLSQSDVSFIVSCTPTDGSCDLEEFVTMGHWFIPSRDFLADRYTLLLGLFGENEDGARAYVFLSPSRDTEELVYSMADGASVLEAELDLSALEPPQLPANPEVEVDWGELTTDAMGEEMDAGDLDRLLLFSFAEADHASDLTGWFTHATASWSLDTDATSSPLTALEGETEFTGIDADSTWLLALYNTRRDLPVPRLVALVELAE